MQRGQISRRVRTYRKGKYHIVPHLILVRDNERGYHRSGRLVNVAAVSKDGMVGQTGYSAP